MGVSVIIPTLNEASCLADSLFLLRRQQPAEIIVADGGSTDATEEMASEADSFLRAPRGRAMQMNAGAARARGDVLLFLHADCSIEDGGLIEAERCLTRRNVVAGCYRMCVRDHGPLFRSLDFFATARVRLTGIVYGDQGLFMARRTFEELGGFPPVQFLEDVLFSQQLRRCGRVEVASKRIFVSPRRWQKTGLVRQTLRNWTLTALAAAGVHPDRLAAYYPDIR